MPAVCQKRRESFGLFLQLQLLCLFVASARALKAIFTTDNLGYTVIDAVTNEYLFIGGNIAIFAGGKWCVAKGASSAEMEEIPARLVLQNKTEIEGADDVLGTFTGVQLTWSCQLTESYLLKAVTLVKNFDSGRDVLFELQFPEGAPSTSIASSPNAAMTNFPSFNTSSLPDALSWQGSFVQGVNGYSTGPTGGPTVFFDASDPKLSTVLVGSPWGGNWKTFSAGNGMNWNGIDGYWAPGTSARIESLPKGFRQSILLHTGSGIASTLAEWGHALQQSRHSKGRKINDVTLSHIGYQTDNGAFYCFCKDKNCSKTLIDVVDYLHSENIPMGYLSFQGAGASSGRGQAPWCVETWGVDGGLGKQYPLDMGSLQRAIGIPLQLYAPYFCPTSPYFDGSNWTAVSSNSSLPGCTDYNFKDVEPSQSRAFYDWFFAKGVDVGMSSFEPDFMNQNFNCVPEFVQSTTAISMWQSGMSQAAEARGVSVQWCYATPTDVLAAVDMPAVTNFRVSFDFCYGESWLIGVSSLLVWALGAAPSKDTLWTTSNNWTAIPGCPWTPDHESPAAELHLILALLSTGPVGISDAIGMANTTLLKRAIRQDGMLLKPSKPITAIDSSFVSSLPSGNTLDGYIYGTAAVGPSWYFVSFKMKESYSVRLLDFWPPVKSSGGPVLLAYRQFGQGGGCKHGTEAVSSGCIRLVSVDDPDPSEIVFIAPKSSFANITSGTDFAPETTTVWQACPENGWFFLGELNKYVALSPARFSKISCTDFGVSTNVEGTAGELVMLTVLQPQRWTLAGRRRLRVLIREVLIPSSGSTMVSFRESGDNNAETA